MDEISCNNRWIMSEGCCGWHTAWLWFFACCCISWISQNYSKETVLSLFKNKQTFCTNFFSTQKNIKKIMSDKLKKWKVWCQIPILLIVIRKNWTDQAFKEILQKLSNSFEWNDQSHTKGNGNVICSSIWIRSVVSRWSPKTICFFPLPPHPFSGSTTKQKWRVLTSSHC